MIIQKQPLYYQFERLILFKKLNASVLTCLLSYFLLFHSLYFWLPSLKPIPKVSGLNIHLLNTYIIYFTYICVCKRNILDFRTLWNILNPISNLLLLFSGKVSFNHLGEATLLQPIANTHKNNLFFLQKIEVHSSNGCYTFLFAKGWGIL